MNEGNTGNQPEDVDIGASLSSIEQPSDFQPELQKRVHTIQVPLTSYSISKYEHDSMEITPSSDQQNSFLSQGEMEVTLAYCKRNIVDNRKFR